MRVGACDFCGERFVDTSNSQNRRWCSDRCRRTAYAHREDVRGWCEDCGALLGLRHGRGPGSVARGRVWRWCIECHNSRQTARLTERAHLIERWWAEGLSRKEIAARLGWSDSRVSVEFAQLRRKGFDLPYRYRMENGTRVAA